jgi:hypothetical protein
MSENLADGIAARIDDLIHKKGSEVSNMTSEELFATVKHLDYLIHNSLDKTDSGLALVSSHFG